MMSEGHPPEASKRHGALRGGRVRVRRGFPVGTYWTVRVFLVGLKAAALIRRSSR